MTIRIGAGPIGWFEDDFSAFRNDIAREAHMTAVVRAGFDGICLNPGSAREVACVHATLARHGLAFIAPTHAIALTKRTSAQVFADLQPHVNAARALGAREMTVCETSTVALSDTDRDRFGARLCELAKAFADAGVRLVYRPRVGTVVASAGDVDTLMAATGATVGLMLDADVFGADIAGVARRHAARIALIAPGSEADAVLAALPHFKGWTLLNEAGGHASERVGHCREITVEMLAA